MAQVVEFTLPADGFPLGRVFENLPSARIEIDRIVPTQTCLFPYFWVWDVDATRVSDVLDGHRPLEAVTLIDDVDGEGLFRVEWDEDADGLVGALGATETALLGGTGTSEGWTFEIRTDDHEALSQFQDRCAEYGVDVTVTRVSELRGDRAEDRHGLTAKQREALVRAFVEGYYDEPRRANLDGLADDLGISRSAFGARLRRGHRNLVRNTVVRHRADAE